MDPEKLQELLEMLFEGNVNPEQLIDIYQGRPAGFDPAGGYSSSFTRQPTFAQSYAGPRGGIYQTQVSQKEWAEGVLRATENVEANLNPSVIAAGLEEARFDVPIAQRSKLATTLDDAGNFLKKINPGIAEFGSGVLDLFVGIPGVADQLMESMFRGIEQTGGYPEGFFRGTPERITSSTRSLPPAPSNKRPTNLSSKFQSVPPLTSKKRGPTII